jgi:hypothetical protein
MKRLKEHAGEPQSHVAEIFLAVDNPSQDAEVRALAEKLTEQMKQGARFSAIAQQFSQSATAAVGGDMGWLRPGSAAPDLAAAVAPLKPGELSPPIRTNSGYYLLLVLDAATAIPAAAQATDTVYDVVQVVFPLPPQPNDAMKRSRRRRGDERARAPRTARTAALGKEKAPQLSSEGKVNAQRHAANARPAEQAEGRRGVAADPAAQRHRRRHALLEANTGRQAAIPARGGLRLAAAPEARHGVAPLSARPAARSPMSM